MKLPILYFLMVSVILAQVEQTTGKNPFSVSPNFFIDLANFKNEDAEKTRVDIFVKVPYSSLQFIKENDLEYIAKYSVSIKFMDEDEEKVMYENIWKEKIVIEDFELTNSEKSANLSYKTVLLKPGQYKFFATVEDEDSRKEYTVNGTANIKEFNSNLDLSDIVLVSDVIDSPNGPTFVPNVNNIFTTDNKVITFFYELYSNSFRNIKVNYSIRDSGDEILFEVTKDMEVIQGVNFLDFSINQPQISLGTYRLIVKIIDENNEELSNRFRIFYSRIFGYPVTINDLTKAIQQLVYIASSEEIEQINSGVDFSDKLKRYKQFWNKKDPTPNTDINEVLMEYYRRVDYANQNFGSYFEGWRSDMGMVYIVLGAPNQVDRHPFEYDSKPYEVWDYYSINKRFIFVDQTGFGDYRLLNPSYGDWYRYRY